MKKFLQKPFKVSLTKNILLILGILVVGYIIVTLSLKIITRHGKEFAVPDLSGMSLTEAAATAEKYHLRLDVTDSVYIRGMERGAIARQNPEAGSMVKKNRRILLVINSVIPRQSTMPSLTGYSLRQARTELASKGSTAAPPSTWCWVSTRPTAPRSYRTSSATATRWPPSCCMTTP